MNEVIVHKTKTLTFKKKARTYWLHDVYKRSKCIGVIQRLGGSTLFSPIRYVQINARELNEISRFIEALEAKG